MKIKDLIAQFDPKTSLKEEASFDKFTELFGIHTSGYSQLFADTLVKHYVSSWICTDTRVGYALYLLGDEIVAVSVQLGRKDRECITFLSTEAAIKVRDFTIQCNDADSEPEFDIVNLDEEVDLYYFDRGE